MKRLVVVNSFGPMASTLVAGLLEKLNFTNLPLRKIRLHQYLMGEAPLDSGLMQTRLRETLAGHSKKQLSGGVSVLDRNNQEPKALTDIAKVESRIDGADASTIQNLYFDCRNIYADAVVYKPVTTNRDWQIELTVDIHRFDSIGLYDAYRENFDDVRMIHIHRPFDKWMNSLASQAFMHPLLKERVMFFPHLRHADYLRYETAVAAMPGHHFNFDEFFDRPVEELYATLARFLEVQEQPVDLRGDGFDMYGKIRPHAVAFTKFDDKVVFLRPQTLEFIAGKARNGTLSKPINAFAAWILYLRDMISYRRKAGLPLI